jgi:hypothetical protein
LFIITVCLKRDLCVIVFEGFAAYNVFGFLSTSRIHPSVGINELSDTTANITLKPVSLVTVSNTHINALQFSNHSASSGHQRNDHETANPSMKHRQKYRIWRSI